MISKLYDLFLAVPRISTDTRHIEPNSIFFALHGANFDGNRFATQALEAGAAYAVVDDPEVAAAHPNMILVENTLSALQDLAREHRRMLGIPILAVAGSNGKTTTKELVSRVLSQHYRISATQGNLNNHIGVPLTLLSMDVHTQFGVVEMGASACGEIALLASIAEPNFGILTNVGLCHLEGFGGPEGVRRGKGELYDYLATHGGTAFVRTEDPVLTEMAAERPALAVCRYETATADGFESQLEGDYNRYNIAAAVAIGRHFEVPEERIRLAISNYTPDNNRSQRMITEHNTLIVDCYNANPSSMKASISNFLHLPLEGRKKRILVLGDMLELGKWSQSEHIRIVREALNSSADHIYLVGNEFQQACEQMMMPCGCAAITLFADRAALAEALQEEPITDSLILMKGSRGIGLEKLIEIL